MITLNIDVVFDHLDDVKVLFNIDDVVLDNIDVVFDHLDDVKVLVNIDDVVLDNIDDYVLLITLMIL